MSDSYDLRVLSLGAGVQSTAILLMALHGVFPKPDVAIFADTQWEPKRVYRHLDWLEKTCAGQIPIVRVSRGDIKAEQFKTKGKRARMPFYTLNPDGSHGQLWRQCTETFKLEQVRKEIRRRCGIQPGRRMTKKVQLWIGISSDEAGRMKESAVPWIDNLFPLKDTTRNACRLWMTEMGYPDPPKSSCVGCPYHQMGFWADMWRNDPEEFEDACRFDDSIRNLAGVMGTAYVHPLRRPLREIDFSGRTQYASQLNIDDFLGECSGICGV